MNLIKKVIYSYKNKVLLKKVQKKIYPYFKGLFLYFVPKKNEENIKVFVSKKIQPDKNDLILAERIFTSFKKMKKDQLSCDKDFQPSTLWTNHLENDYRILGESLKNDDCEKFLFFLSNFGNWEHFLGIENQILIKKYNNNFLLKNFLINVIFAELLKTWKYFGNNKSDIHKLKQPRFGNQIGATIDGNFVTIGSFFSCIYSDILNNFIVKKDRPIVADLGGGYGKFGYYLLKNQKKFCFIDFDLPEVLTLASFYLMKTWPDKKTLLYGEKDFKNDDIYNYDLIFLPSFEIEKLKNNTIDLFVNKNSLGEMMPNTSKKLIDNICRSTKTFFHINHETFRNCFENNTKSLLNKEYPIHKDFQLLFRYPDLNHLIYENGKLDYDSDIFVYCYQKKSD